MLHSFVKQILSTYIRIKRMRVWGREKERRRKKGRREREVN